MPVYRWTVADVPLVVRTPQFDKPWSKPVYEYRLKTILHLVCIKRNSSIYLL
jgi:hypothetical protein